MMYLFVEEGATLAGDKRIDFLTTKIQEIRKLYMSLKSEVSTIDRRRKRARRKERESKFIHFWTFAWNTKFCNLIA